MKTVTTVCARDCYDACSLIYTVDDLGQIHAVRGDPSHPFTRGFTCPRGAKDHERLCTNRIQSPGIRRHGSIEQSNWEDALNVVSHTLREVLDTHGPRAVLYLDYAGNTGVLSESYPQRLWYALGATRTDHALCSKSGHTGLALHYGSSYGVTPEEVSEAKLILFWGFNAAVSSPHFAAIARKARKQRGTKIVVIDPVKNRTVKIADLWVRPQPGTDVALAYGVMNYLMQHRYIDRSFIRGWTEGFEQLQDEAARWPPGRVEQVTGVPWNHVERLGEAYHHLRPGATMIGIGLQKCTQGADQVRAVSLIPALLGQPRGFFYSNGDSYTIDSALLSGKSLCTRPVKIVEQVALAERVKQGQFTFIYINGMNPAMTLPNTHVFREGLLRDDVFVVVHDTHWSHTAEYADVTLPAPTYLEKDDLVIPWTHNIARLSPAIVPPVTDSRRETWVMQELARRLEVKERWVYDNPWDAVQPAFEEAFDTGSFASLRAGATLTFTRASPYRYATPSGKLEFFAAQAGQKGWHPLPQQHSRHVEDGWFTLLSSASSHYTHTQFQEVHGKIPAIVKIHPQDAERLGIAQGDRVELSNDQSTVRVQAELSEDVPQGVLWGPRQYAGLDGTPQNSLMSGHPQSIGKGPRFNSTRVRLSKCI